MLISGLWGEVQQEILETQIMNRFDIEAWRQEI